MRGFNYLFHLVLLWAFHVAQKIGHCLFALFNYRWKNVRLPPIDDNVLFIPATELARKIKKRELRSEDVVAAYIARLRAVNPLINAVCFDRYDDALEEARAIDAKLDKEGESNPPEGGWPPLYGVPITVKEAFALTGFQHTGGLKNRVGCIAKNDAPPVVNLKKAGAVILATTNVSELCMWFESHNRVYGITRNPYNLGAIVGGSSGGEGAVVGSGASVFGLGSDIGGSIRMPAFFCGVFGHKASTGVIESSGQFPDCDSPNEWFMISAGPICRYASDLPLFTSILLKPSLDKELRLFDAVDLSKLKYFSLEEWDVKAHVTDAVEAELVNAQKQVTTTWGMKVGVQVQSIRVPDFFYQFPMWAGMMSDKPENCQKFTQLMAGGPPQDLNPVVELLKWFVGLSGHTFPAITLGIAELGQNKQRALNKRQAEHCRNLRNKIASILADDGVLFCPVHPKAGYYHYETILHVGNFTYTGIWNALGFPATSVPLGLSTRGLPLGIQIVSNFRNDRYNLAVAKRLEELFGGWVRPK